jgi:hypothetical protein
VEAVAEMTVPQRILLAAYRLEKEGNTPFSAEALIVAVWREHPRAFGLKGFADQYPDSNRVLSCIMGKRGLAQRGWLAKMGAKLYSLSREGREEVLRLGQVPEKPAPGPRPQSTRVKVPRDQERFLLNLASAPAVRSYNQGFKREITYRDARRFWGITDTMHGAEVTEAVERVPATLTDLEQYLVKGSFELSNGRTVSRDELQGLAAVHQFLAEQFARHISQQRNAGARS